jgi:hypothetical protein
LLDDGDVDPFYTLSDQLFVEPQPNALPDAFDLTRPIRMSRRSCRCALAHRRLESHRTVDCRLCSCT